MENNISPSVQAKQIETQISVILRKVKRDELAERPRKALAQLGQALADAKLYARGYELSETADERAQNAKTAKKYLDEARQLILGASEFNVFGPVDVAHLSAQIDQLVGDLM